MKMPWTKAVERARTVEVGWLLADEASGFVWDDPRRIRRDEPNPKHAKALTYCPATIDHNARMFEVPCPIDANLGFLFDAEGRPLIRNLDGDASTIRSKQLNSMLAILDRKEWRHPDRPVIQLITPYVFVADEPVYMSQVPPTDHYARDRLPGLMVAGRFPIHLWPRRMMWAFEWFDTKAPLVLRRGEPWFYVRFEAADPSRPFRMVEVENTPSLKEYMAGVHGVTNYVNRTYSLFKIAERRRPKTLMTPKVR